MSDNLYLIELNITKSCNFKCSYCFEGDSCRESSSIQSSLDDVFSFVDSLLEDEWFKSIYGGVKFDFWGGEPTLRPDLIRKVLHRYGDTARYHIYTNGYNSDIVDIFSGYERCVDIQVSYDGNPVHDLNRIHVDGSATSDRVIETMRLLNEKGFNFNIKSTITPKDFVVMPQAWDDIKMLRGEFPSLSYAPTIDYSRSYDNHLEDFDRACKDISRKEIEFFRTNGRYLMTWFDLDIPRQCTLSKHGMFVDVDGSVYYCHGCVYENCDDLRFGHILDVDLIDKIKNNNQNFKTYEFNIECSRCSATMCNTCNVSKYINSKKTDFYEKWYDFPCQPDMCLYYKQFGLISRAVKNILKRGN